MENRGPYCVLIMGFRRRQLYHERSKRFFGRRIFERGAEGISEEYRDVEARREVLVWTG
jgi:hypothetical protein